MSDRFEWTKDHVGKRVIYTARSGKQSLGTVREVLKISENSGYMIDTKLDGSSRTRNYIPGDMLTLVPDELEGTLG
jgi:hypothetical protein